MAGNRSSSQRGRTTGTKGRSRQAEAPRLLDDRSTRDLIGVALSVTALALMIAVVDTTTGVAAEFIARSLRGAFGVGSFLIPIGLLLWGVSFFVRLDIQEGRTGAGIALVLLAIISLAAITPEGPVSLDGVAVQSQGGYVGGGLAWLLARLAGQTIAAVLLSGLLIAGLILTGLSISALIESIRDRLLVPETPASVAPAATRRRKAAALEDEEEFAAALTTPTARKAKSKPVPAAVEEAATAPIAKSVAPSALQGFELPDFSLLKRTTETASHHRATENELRTTAAVLTDTLATFDIPARVVSWIVGPTVTLFEIEIAKGVRLNKVTALADDLALALAASTVRILAPIPGKSLVGIEVPNVRRSAVTLGDVLAPPGQGGPLFLAVGKDVAGDSTIADLAEMPHLLIGGSTGSGKSVAINAMLMSILMRATPSEVRLILIDPKRVELAAYNGVPHLYVPVVTEPKEAASALAWCVSEMDRRLKLLQVARAKNIGMYNHMIQQGKGPEGHEEMPYLCIVIDELADLMMVAAKEVEDSICRIAQLARAAGIHLIVATQRPEANVVTGLIKANITHRIAFSVASGLDSRVVLDTAGAEKLTGKGDMLFSTPELPKPKRIQGCFVAEDEIEKVVEHLKNQGQPDYHEEILHLRVSQVGGGVDSGEDDDPMLWEAADIVVTSGLGSTSLLQRRLKVGYARAGRIMDMLESKGVVGPPDGSKPREVLVDIEDLESIKVFEREDREHGG